MAAVLVIVLAVALAACIGVLRLWILLRPSREAFDATRLVSLETRPNRA